MSKGLIFLIILPFLSGIAKPTYDFSPIATKEIQKLGEFGEIRFLKNGACQVCSTHKNFNGCKLYHKCPHKKDKSK